jgi:hypothetical protein
MNLRLQNLPQVRPTLFLTSLSPLPDMLTHCPRYVYSEQYWIDTPFLHTCASTEFVMSFVFSGFIVRSTALLLSCSSPSILSSSDAELKNKTMSSANLRFESLLPLMFIPYHSKIGLWIPPWGRTWRVSGIWGLLVWRLFLSEMFRSQFPFFALFSR